MEFKFQIASMFMNYFPSSYVAKALLLESLLTYLIIFLKEGVNLRHLVVNFHGRIDILNFCLVKFFAHVVNFMLPISSMFIN